MRKWLVLSSALLIVAAFAGTAAATTYGSAPAKAKAPVTLTGKVNNKGTQSASGNKITIEQDDYYFNPTFVKAKPGTTLTVKVKNEGKQEHTFTIPGTSVDADIQPGKSATVQVMVASDGALLFYCRLHGPNGTSGRLGMQGAIFTQSGQTVTNATGSSTSQSAQATLQLADSKYGKILVDANGKTLYLRDSDTPTMVTCTGGCATAWPPLIVSGTPVAGAGITASKLSTLAGDNGIQVTYAGHPLYGFASDHAAGDTSGEGAGGFWVLGADGQKITTAAAPKTPAATSSRGY